MNRIIFAKRFATRTPKDFPEKTSIVLQAMIDLCFSTMGRPDFINDCKVTGEGTVIGACVQSGTIVGRAMQKEENLMLPESYAITSSQASSSMIHTTFGSDVSIAKVQECIDMIFHSAGKMLQIHKSIFDVLSKRSNTRLSTIPNHVGACRSPRHTCKNTTT